MVGGYNRHNFIKSFETTKNSQEISQHLGGMTKKTDGLTDHPYHGWLACYSDLLAKIQAKKKLRSRAFINDYGFINTCLCHSVIHCRLRILTEIKVKLSS